MSGVTLPLLQAQEQPQSFSLSNSSSLTSKDTGLGELTNPKTISVVIATPRGGFGDIVANIKMAEELKKVYPHAKVRLIIDELADESYYNKTLEALTKLFPTFCKTCDIQEIDDFQFYMRKFPQSDVAFQFSADLNYNISQMSKYAPHSFVFPEYGEFYYTEHDRFFDPKTHLPTVEYESLEIVKVKGETRHIVSIPSGVQGKGLYLSSQKSELKYKTKKDALNAAGKYLGFDAAEIEEFLEYDELGFSYNAYADSENGYVKAMYELAKENPDKKYLIIMSGNFDYIDGLTETMPHNLMFVNTTNHKGLPLDISNALIAHSTIPVNITGDLSLTTAIEYGKPFIYEFHRWKALHHKELFEKLKTTEAFKKAPEKIEFLQKIMGIKSGKMKLEGHSSKELPCYQMLKDKDFQNVFSQALKEIKQNHSLPVNIKNILSSLNTILNSSMTPIEKQKSFSAALHPTNCSLKNAQYIDEAMAELSKLI